MPDLSRSKCETQTYCISVPVTGISLCLTPPALVVCTKASWLLAILNWRRTYWVPKRLPAVESTRRNWRSFLVRLHQMKSQMPGIYHCPHITQTIIMRVILLIFKCSFTVSIFLLTMNECTLSTDISFF